MLPFFLYLLHTNWHLDNVVHLFLFNFFPFFSCQRIYEATAAVQVNKIMSVILKSTVTHPKKEQVDILTIMKSLTRHYSLGTSLFPQAIFIDYIIKCQHNTNKTNQCIFPSVVTRTNLSVSKLCLYKSFHLRIWGKTLFCTVFTKPPQLQNDYGLGCQSKDSDGSKILSQHQCLMTGFPPAVASKSP